MRSPPWRLVALLALLCAASLGPASPGVGEGAAAPAPVYGMVFPLLGEHTLTDSFGDPRGRSRRHAGVDLLADKGVPVVAVADGTVRWVHAERGGRCCNVALRHDDGWRSRYLHLDNDTPGTDDGRAVGIAPGVRRGARVVAGQVLGWVGDSGNAEDTVPHLHFELRRPDGTPVDPLPSLRAALEIARPAVAPPVRGGAVAGDGGGEDGGDVDGDGGTGGDEGRGGLLGWLMDGGAREGGGARGDGGAEDAEAQDVEAQDVAREDGAREGRGWLSCFGFARPREGD